MMTAASSSAAWAVLSVLGDHLWQSSLVAIVAGLLTLALRRNRPDVRAWVWLLALMKFFVPFGVLVALGRHLSWQSASSVSGLSDMTFAIDALSQPFSQSSAPPVEAISPRILSIAQAAPFFLLAAWLVGTAVILTVWFVRWRRIAVAIGCAPLVNDGRDLDALRRLERLADIKRPLVMVSSQTQLEPGVFGIVRPVLLWSRGIGEHLSDAQVEAVLAHEVCHVRRRDNLLAVVQMLVEAVFWFHPLVWWLGGQLVKERERACDEEVLRWGADPRVYAEGIVKICEFYVESPLACVAGVTGSDLKKRIEAIMSNHPRNRLTMWRRLLLGATGALTIIVPVTIGLATAPRLRAQLAVDATKPAFDVVSIKRNPSGIGPVRMRIQPGGLFTASNLTLLALLQNAYGAVQGGPTLDDFRIVGAPEWASVGRFDIVAKAAGTVSREQMSLMLQTLLADRFKLTLHHEVRQLPVYALVLVRNDRSLGPQLRAGEPDCKDGPPIVGQPRPILCAPEFGPPGRVSARAISMAKLAANLSSRVHRVVLNQTGLSGVFAADLQWAPDSSEGSGPLGPPPASADGPPPPANDGLSLFTALQEQLGLKLEATKGPVDVVVIDHVEQPTDNQADPVSPSPVPAGVPQPQAQIAPVRPTFEVASIKPNNTGRTGVLVFPPTGGLTRLINHPLIALVANAYHVSEDQIVGPDWIHTSRFDVMAKAPSDPSMSTGPNSTALMMRALLEDRFRLTTHVETRPIPKYALVIARSDGRLGRNLQRSGTDCASERARQAAQPVSAVPRPCGVLRSAISIVADSVPLSQLAVLLTGPVSSAALVDRDIVDETGLTGVFSFNLDLDPSVSIFTAIEEQLGLKLKPITVPSAVVVIDHVEQPTPD